MANLFAVGLVFFLLLYGMLWIALGKRTNEVLWQAFVWLIKGTFSLLLTFLRLIFHTVAAILEAIIHATRKGE